MVLPDVDPPPYATQVDLTMLAVLGSRERTLEEYKILLETADFQFTSITPSATPFSLIEAVAVSARTREWTGLSRPCRQEPFRSRICGERPYRWTNKSPNGPSLSTKTEAT